VGGTLFGRERHLREFGVALQALHTKRGNLVLLAGDAGTGKTRLADAAIELAQADGIETSWVTCWAEAGAPPYWPWSEFLRTVAGIELRAEALGEMRGEPSPDRAAARFRLFEDVWHQLRAAVAVRPRLLVIDDLHWADLPSLRLLAYVAPRLHEIGLVVIGTYRDSDIDVAPALGAVLPDLVRHGRSLTVSPLNVEELGAYVTDLRGAPVAREELTKLHWLSGGNPLFARELISLTEGEAEGTRRSDFSLPETVRATLARRLDRLSPECGTRWASRR
jgi:predicted ATPase